MNYTVGWPASCRDVGLDILYCDEFLLAVNKPAGVLAVPGRGADKQDCVAAWVRREFPDALIVHRLDMATSGLLLFARGAEMQSVLSCMFRDRQVEKRYVAVVNGVLDPPQGEIDLPLTADWPNRPRQKVDAIAGKPALTRYRVITRHDDVCRVELEPVTGRTHQLRVHLAAVGHAIVGDALYGARATGRLLLHACALRLSHPRSGALLELACDPPF